MFWALTQWLALAYACILPTWCHIWCHKSRRQILLSPPIWTGRKNKAHRGETSCLKSHSSTLQSDSKDCVCGYCTLLTLHMAVMYKAPRTSMHKKTWFLTQRSFHALHTSFLVPVMLSLQHPFLLTLKTEVRPHRLQPHLTAQGVPWWCLMYAWEQRQYCLLVIQTWLKFWLHHCKTPWFGVGYFISLGLSFCMYKMGLL